MAEWDPDGRSLLTVTGGGVIARIEAATGSMRWSACCTSIYGDVRYAPGGRIFVHGGHNPSRRDAASGVLLDKLVPARSGPAYGPVAFDLSRGHVCFGSQDGSVLCRDAGTLAPAAAPPRQPGWIESIAFSVDGERAALAVSGAGLRLWDRRTGAVTTTSGMPTSNVVLSADGSTAMFGTADGRIEFRSATDGRVSRSIDCR
jgi:WD40 repeat protein